MSLEEMKLRWSIILIIGTTVAATALAEGPIAHYPLLSDAGDATGNNPNMVLANAPFQDGGVYCNGVYGSYTCSTPNIDSLDMSLFTVQAEFKISDYGSGPWMPVIIGGSGWRWVGIVLDAGGTLNLLYNNGVLVSSAVNVSLDEWHTVTITYDGGAGRCDLFFDGQFLLSKVFVLNHGGDRDVSTENGANGTAFHGLLRHLYVWNSIVPPSTAFSVSGTVFEDTDFAGTATEWDGGTSDVAQPNVAVELYSATDANIAVTTTDIGGNYIFTGLTDGAYKVRVRSASLGGPDAPPAGGYNTTVPATWPYPLPEMTWGNGAVLIGGQDPMVDDTATGDNAGPGDTYVGVAVSGTDVSGVNFGFSYELIVNEDDDANADDVRSKQGTLRQFIKNSNAIAGTQKSWFQITGP